MSTLHISIKMTKGRRTGAFYNGLRIICDCVRDIAILSVKAEGRQGRINLTLKKLMEDSITDGRVLVGVVKGDNRRLGADNDFSYTSVAGVSGKGRQVIDKPPSCNMSRSVRMGDVVLELLVTKRVL